MSSSSSGSPVTSGSTTPSVSSFHTWYQEPASKAFTYSRHPLKQELTDKQGQREYDMQLDEERPTASIILDPATTNTFSASLYAAPFSALSTLSASLPLPLPLPLPSLNQLSDLLSSLPSLHSLSTTDLQELKDTVTVLLSDGIENVMYHAKQWLRSGGDWWYAREKEKERIEKVEQLQQRRNHHQLTDQQQHDEAMLKYMSFLTHLLQSSALTAPIPSAAASSAIPIPPILPSVVNGTVTVPSPPTPVVLSGQTLVLDDSHFGVLSEHERVMVERIKLEIAAIQKVTQPNSTNPIIPSQIIQTQRQEDHHEQQPHIHPTSDTDHANRKQHRHSNARQHEQHKDQQGLLASVSWSNSEMQVGSPSGSPSSLSLSLDMHTTPSPHAAHTPSPDPAVEPSILPVSSPLTAHADKQSVTAADIGLPSSSLFLFLSPAPSAVYHPAPHSPAISQHAHPHSPAPGYLNTHTNIFIPSSVSAPVVTSQAPADVPSIGRVNITNSSHKHIPSPQLTFSSPYTASALTAHSTDGKAHAAMHTTLPPSAVDVSISLRHPIITTPKSSPASHSPHSFADDSKDSVSVFTPSDAADIPIAPPLDDPSSVPMAPPLDSSSIPVPPPLSSSTRTSSTHIPPPMTLRSGVQSSTVSSCSSAPNKRCSLKRVHWSKLGYENVQNSVWSQIQTDDVIVTDDLFNLIDLRELEEKFSSSANSNKHSELNNLQSGHISSDRSTTILNEDGTTAMSNTMNPIDSDRLNAVNASRSMISSFTAIDTLRAYNVEIAFSQLKMSASSIKEALMLRTYVVEEQVIGKILEGLKAQIQQTGEYDVDAAMTSTSSSSSLVFSLPLTIDQLDILSRIVPTEEEAARVYALCAPTHSPGIVESFFRTMVEVPHVKRRVDLLLAYLNTPSDIQSFIRSLSILNKARQQLLSSTAFRHFLSVILIVGNTLNEGTSSGAAYGFRLSWLKELEGVKTSDGKMTMMEWIVRLNERKPQQQPSSTSTAINTAPGGAGLLRELSMIPPAAQLEITTLTTMMQSFTQLYTQATQELSSLTTATITAATTTPATAPRTNDPFCHLLSVFLLAFHPLLSLLSQRLDQLLEDYAALSVYLAENDMKPDILIQLMNDVLLMYKKALDDIHRKQAQENEKKKEQERRQEKERYKQQRQQKEQQQQLRLQRPEDNSSSISPISSPVSASSAICSAHSRSPRSPSSAVSVSNSSNSVSLAGLSMNHSSSTLSSA